MLLFPSLLLFTVGTAGFGVLGSGLEVEPLFGLGI